jgi:hypothetical protein
MAALLNLTSNTTATALAELATAPTNVTISGTFSGSLALDAAPEDDTSKASVVAVIHGPSTVALQLAAGHFVRLRPLDLHGTTDVEADFL